MDNLEDLDGRAGLSVDGSMQSSDSFKGSENLGNDSAFYEKFLLEDLDSYWDDLNARLTVSRMVSDSVIKGMVNAVAEEAAEKISSKEAEVAKLNERLQLFESDAAKYDKLRLSMVQEQLKGTRLEVRPSCLDSSTEYTECLSSLKFAAEKQLQKLMSEIRDLRSSNSLRYTDLGSGNVGLCSVLHQGKVPDKLNQMDESVDALQVILAAVYEHIGDVVSSLKDLLYEQQWKWEIQKEVDTVVVQNFVRGLQEEFETKLCEQKSLLISQNKNWLKKVDELSRLRQELDSISKSLSSPELGQLLSHASHESFEEWNNAKRKDHFPCKVLGNHLSTEASLSEENGIVLMEKPEKTVPEVADSPQLLRMTKEELINYYKTEMTKMKRQQESALHEKTEELFILKREFLKEKGSSHFRRDKEFEILRKRIPEVIVKLGNILDDREKFPVVQNNHSLKDRIDSLLWENQRLRALLVDKRKEVKCLSSQVSDAASQMSSYSSSEANLLRQIERLKWDVEDVKIEAFIRDEINTCVSRELFVEVKSHMEDLEMETEMVQGFYGIILRGFIADVKFSMNPIMMKYDEEIQLLEAVLLEKEKALDFEVEKMGKLKQDVASLSTLIEEKENALGLEVEKTEKLKQDIASFSTLLEEKDKFTSEAGSTLRQQKENFEIVSQELNMLRDQASDQERLISENRKESSLIKGRLDEALEQVHQYEAKVSELNQKFSDASSHLKEAEKQNAMLHDIIQEKQNKVSSTIERENDQRKQMKSIIISVQELSKAVAEFESIMTENIERKNSRLEILCYQCNPLIKQADFHRRKGLWYKHRLEIRSSDLQKAEIEVDLLGDEVDVLLSLLEKIYIALDHYSPVLKHYPGVMEILKLIRRELKGNC